MGRKKNATTAERAVTDHLDPDTALQLAGRAVTRLNGQIERALATSGLTPAQYRLMFHLARGPSFPSELADLLEIRRPSLTTLAAPLVARGFIAKTSRDGDRRRVQHELTDSGRRALAETEQSVALVLDWVTAHLDPADRERVLDGLVLLYRALDRAAAAQLLALRRQHALTR